WMTHEALLIPETPFDSCCLLSVLQTSRCARQDNYPELCQLTIKVSTREMQYPPVFSGKEP
ncbi:hypothetical protein, partial [Klebsiella pneumoniae]|uniref:hypothetical protein n=1 Tax=Klebsiella pneumoniae TaxID=573 RepID=UPI001D0F0D9D